MGAALTAARHNAKPQRKRAETIIMNVCVWLNEWIGEG